jgi:putative MFS transporter
MTGTGHGPAKPVAGRPQAPAGAGAARALGARIDRLPVWGLSRAFFGVLGLSFFFAYFDISAIGVDMAPMLADLHIPLADSGPPVTWGLIGYVGGSAVFGHLADAIGRRTALRLSIATLAVGSLLTACSWDLVSVTVFRTLTGFGIGAQIAVATTLAGELAGRSVRGRTVALSALGGAVAFVVTPLVGLGLTPFAHTGWRVVFALGAVSALLLPFSGDRWLPESPRWLAGRGRADDAERIMADIERKVTALTGRPLPEPQVREISPEAATAGARRLGFAALFQGRLRRRTLVVCALWFLGYFAQYGVSTWLPTIYQTGYHLPKSQALNYATMTSLAGFVGCLVAALTVDRIGRRWVTAAGLFLGGLTLLVLALTGSDSADQVVLWTSIAMVFNFACNISLYVYTPELYPTGARALGTSVGGAANRIGVILGPLIVGLVYTGGTGTAGVFALLGCAALLGSVVSGVFAEETTGRTLEEASA